MVHKAVKENGIQTESVSSTVPRIPRTRAGLPCTECIIHIHKIILQGLKNSYKVVYNSIKEAKNRMIELYRNIKLNLTLRKSRVLKRDKNIHERKKYFTLMVVPNSSNKVKTIRISRFCGAWLYLFYVQWFFIYLFVHISELLLKTIRLDPAWTSFMPWHTSRSLL